MENPGSLKNICYKYIGQNLQSMINGSHERIQACDNLDLVYADNDIVLPQTIAEQLLTTLSESKRLDDVTVGIFKRKHCKLTKIHIKRRREAHKTRIGDAAAT